MANAPADQTLAPGGDAVTIELASVFSDPDDDTLTYTVWLSNAERLSLSGLTGTAFTLTPLAPGRMVVTVVATDPEGLSAVLTFEVTVTVGDRDYDADDDGLIEVGTLAHLHAMRFDLDGDGLADEPANWSQYHDHAAFVEGSWDMGCPAGCSGYELTADLDFDTDGDGDVDSGDDYWNNGRGWRPVGAGNAFRATFDGNGHTVSNLFIHRNRYAGLFGTVVDGVVRGVGLLDVDVTGGSLVGGLVGYKGDGEISGSYVTGSVSGDDYVGGLVGRSGAPFVDDESHSAVTGSYSTAHVSGREFVGGLVGLGSVITASFATGHVEGTESVGGLVGRNDRPITASYATGRVEGRENVGGLVGFGTGRTTITAGYATGLVWGDEKVGGLVGWDRRTKAERFSASYWDIHTSGHAIGPRGRTTTELQAPTDYGGIYRTWNVDLDGDTVADDPWDFGTSAQYPVLAVDLDGNGEATWQEFGYQLRAGPVLTASTSAGQPVVLTWTAADTSHWSPPPELAYTLIRDDGTTVEILASNLAGLRYTDSDVTAGATYTYQVAAVVDGGAATRSTLVEVVAGVANQPPMIVVGTLRDRTLQVGATEVVDVAGAFSDLDDALTYTASSSDVDVATVSVSGARVTITPVAPGRTTITVTATDAGGSNTTVTHRFQLTTWTGTGVDYDADDDGLIDIATLAQLDAVRYDLDGDGVPVHRELEAGFSVEVEPVVYAEAFPAAATGMGCPSGGGCTGYELQTDLDFDTNGDGRADAGDEYWDHGKGWEPISEVGFAFRAVFEGNRHTIRNLFIRRFTGGLFGGNAGVIRRVRLIDVDVSATAWVGGLVAQSRGEIHASYVTGRVAGEDWVGGLVGSSFGGLVGTSGGGTITASYSTARVTGTDKWVGGLVGVNSGAISGSYATGRVSGYGQVGGLIGCHIRRGSVVASYATGIVSGRGDVGGLIGSTECSAGSPVVTASYATGRVSGRINVGGLIGLHCGSLAAGYATGPVWGGSHVGGLIGSTECSAGSAVVTASYWDTVTSGLSSSAAGTGQTTSALQAPTDYSGIYSQWNVDLDGNGTNDDPWHFGTGSQYPALKVNFDGQGAATWQEFGYQLRAGPTLEATSTETTAGSAQVNLTWTAADVSHWIPPPDVTYAVTRADGSTVETLAEDLGELRYADSAARSGATYTYRVAAVVDEGEAVRGVLVVNTSGNSPPVPVATLPDRWLHVGDAAGVEAEEAFQDPEDDTLTFTAASTATGVARVSVSGTRVTITPVAAGTATITVTATDAGGSTASTTQTFTVTVLPSSAIDYDTDDDGLIEITSLRQLDAVRHDVDGDGDPRRGESRAYGMAFPGVDSRQGCGGLTGCVGYELGADLDFDTNGNGLADKDDEFWNIGRGWYFIGDSPYTHSFQAVFEGNGHTISNLFIDHISREGLFGLTGPSSVIRHVGLIGVSVSSTDDVGGLVGTNSGLILGSYVTGTVSGTGAAIGGLVGENRGSVVASYAAVEVTGGDDVGGLVGANHAAVAASYATGRVGGGDHVGGLVGANGGSITASYATGPVAGEADAGGLVGSSQSKGTTGAATASYWDTTTSRRTTGAGGGQGWNTAALQAPTGYSGIYSAWNVDLDGDGTADSPWHFGTNAQYPALSVDADGVGGATWQELGHQLRAGPTLTVTADGRPVALSWTAVDASAWRPPPDVTYTVTRDDGTAVTVIGEALSGRTHADTAVPVGATRAYQVAAVVAGGETVRSAPVSVTGVALNQPPVAVGTLAPRTLPIAAGTVSVEVSGAFSDPENDALTYGAVSSAPAVAGASVSGSVVTVRPQAAGVATITVTATDGGGSGMSATQAFVVTVPNRPPAVADPLPDRSVRVSDGVFRVDVSSAFSDPDGDTLTYGASSSDTSVAAAVVGSGAAVSVTPVSGGTATITVTATDVGGSNTMAMQTFTVTVANRSPVAEGSLPALSLRVRDGARSVSVSNAFSDPDGDPLTYGTSSSDESVATVSVSGSTVSVAPVSGGTATITVTAEDGGGLRATQTFEVTVENRSPERVGSLPPLSLRVADGGRSVDVSGAFSDPDGDALTYRASSSDPLVVRVAVPGSGVWVRPVSGGTATVEVTATDVDGSNTSATQTFEVTVENRPPEAVGSLPPLTRRVADGAATVEVSGALRDPDGDPLTYGVSSSDGSVARVSVSGSRVTVTPVSPGTAVVTVTATDRGGSNTPATQAFTVTVPANAGPAAVGRLEDKALGVNDASLEVEVSGAFRDPDRDALTYAARSSDESVATVSVSGSTVRITPVVQGTTSVTVTATDRSGSNTSATQTFRVTVAGNRSPEPVGTLRALSLRVADGAELVEVSGAFRDRDGDPLTFGAWSSDGSVVRASATGETVTVTPVAGGTATVTVTARDVSGSDTSATQAFEVTVANQSPEAVGTLPGVSLRVENGAETVRVDFAFRDPDGDPLTYEASSSDGSVARASAAGSAVTVVPVSGGTATVTVTARDVGGSNTTATQTFAATVANRAPLPVGRLPALPLRVSEGERSVPVADAFEDPDRDVLSYGASSSDDSVATAVATGSTVRVTPFSSGTATVTVTAADAGGLRAEQAFAVTVANRSPERVGSLPALELQTAAGAVPVEVSGAFRDPDDDVLSYGATSSAVTVAAVTVSTSPSRVMVMVTPLSRGSAEVTVTATDVAGSNTSATQAFGVRVDGGGGPGPGPGGPPGGGRNRAPQAVGTLADRTLEVGESPPVEVAGAFRDRDGDVLTYAADSSAAEVAAVSVSGGVVSVTALSVGEAEVTVTATDAEGSNRSAAQSFAVTVSHDADGDGLIGVHTPAQLDALRHDLDGDGVPAAAGAAGYAAAFGVTDSGAGTGTVRCRAAGGCRGYELGADLEFDTNGSGGADAGNAWWNGGAGWLPLGTLEAPFTTTFEGNGRRIRGLFVRGGDVAGLFGATGSSSVVRGVGVTAVDVTGGTAVGGLVGANAGTVTGSHATGRVSGSEAVGGLVGRNTGDGVVVGSYAAVEVSGSEAVGGLVGANAGGVAAVHATGRVSGTRRVGGLVGFNRGALAAGYATGRVFGAAESGGLAGLTEPPGTVTASYWDTDTSGRASGGSGDRAATAGRGLPTAALQAPVDYAGLYAAWSVDVDGDGAADAPWDFGTVLQYPALSLDVDGDGVAGWREVGRQLRAGPALTAAPAVDPARVDLTWTAADAGARTPAPEVTYTVTRETGAALETVATDVRGLRYVDRAVEPGSAYSYQVAAVVAGGEAARSALVPAAVPCAFLVAPLHRDVLWTAGTGEVSVSTGPACAWTAASGSEDFLTVTSDAAGTGSGTVTWAVEANAGVPREGALLVAGRRVTVYQASPTVFTDHPILPGVTPVRAIHFRELRARINELRTGAGLPAFEWTDPTLTPGVTPVKRVHLTELRRALSEAYAATGRAGPAYRDALAAGGTVIGAAQMMELRAAVRALEAVRPPT